MARSLCRREFMRSAGLAVSGALLAACQPKVVEVEKVVKETVQVEVEKVVEKIVKETVIVKGTPQVVEKVVTVQAAPKERVDLRFVAWADVQDLDVYEKMSLTFMQNQGDIKVQLEQYPGGYYDKITANFAAGMPADLIYWQGWRWQLFADEDLLIPIDVYIDRDAHKWAFEEVEGIELGTMWHGETYMTSVDTGSMVMFYNKDLFDRAGVEYPTDDWTYDQFKEIIKATTMVDGDIRYYGYAAQPWGGVSGYFDALGWIRQHGKPEWDQISEPHESRWDQPEIIDALQFMINDVTEYKWAPEASALQGGGVTIATGRVAMCPQGPWFLPQMHGEKARTEGGINYDVVVCPTGASGHSEHYFGADGHTVSKASEHPEACWEFMKHTVSDQGQLIIAEGGRMPGRSGTIEKFWVGLANEKYNLANSAAFLKTMLTGRFLITGGRGLDEAAVAGTGSPLRSAFDAMNGLEKTAKEALEEANPKVQKIIDAYWSGRS